MASAAFPKPDTAFRLRVSLDDRHGWGFTLLLAVVATLFLRPADIIPSLEDWPVYQFLIVSCLVVSIRATLRQLTLRKLAEQPATSCLIVLLVAVGASHLSHGLVWAARMSMYEVGKLVVFYLLITGLVNTPRRLTQFMRWLTLAITFVASLAILDRIGVVSIAAFESIQSHGVIGEGKSVFVERIRGTGIFQDPNDLGLILVTGLIFCASFLLKPRAGWPRHVWLIPGVILLIALAMTHSRGALLSFAFAFPAALIYCRSWRLGALSLLALPLLAVVFSGRMTDITALNDGTGQSRIQLWSDSLLVWRQSPVFGIGEGFLVEESGVVTHNSFLHCFAELGVFGGIAFLACFLAASLGLWSLRGESPDRDKTRDLGSSDRVRGESADVAHLRVFVFTALAAYSAGLLTLSRQFVVPTYLILGLATSAQSLHCPEAMRWRIGNQFLLVTVAASAATMAAFYIAVRIFVRW